MILVDFILMYALVSITYLVINAMLIALIGKNDGAIVSLALTTLIITILIMEAL